MAVMGRRWAEAGARRSGAVAAPVVASAGAGLAFGLGGGALLALVAWSVAGPWRFPHALPEALSLRTWAGQATAFAAPASVTFGIAVAAALVALVLVVGRLERGRAASWAEGWLYLPIMLPQVAFLFGLQLLALGVGVDGTAGAVLLAHLVVVLPYTHLALAGPWRGLDPRYARTARALGKPAWTVVWQVKTPILLRPLLLAAAIGFSVSVAQYLATLLLGGGHYATLTVDILATAAGADRRALAVTALTLAVLPLTALSLAVAVPGWRARRRAGG